MTWFANCFGAQWMNQSTHAVALWTTGFLGRLMLYGTLCTCRLLLRPPKYCGSTYAACKAQYGGLNMIYPHKWVNTQGIYNGSSNNSTSTFQRFFGGNSLRNNPKKNITVILFIANAREFRRRKIKKKPRVYEKYRNWTKKIGVSGTEDPDSSNSLPIFLLYPIWERLIEEDNRWGFAILDD